MRRNLATLAIVAALAFAAPPARAYHDTLGIGGGAPVHVLIVIALVVIVALVLLSRWQPTKRGRRKAGGSAKRSYRGKPRG